MYIHHTCMLSLSDMPDSLRSMIPWVPIEPAKLLCAWNFPGKKTKRVAISHPRDLQHIEL